MDTTLDPSKLTDRELLLLLHERQSVTGRDVKELKDGTQGRLAEMTVDIGHLKEAKAEKAIVERLERQQQRLFNYLWAGFGALAVLQFIMPIIVKTYFN